MIFGTVGAQAPATLPAAPARAPAARARPGRSRELTEPWRSSDTTVSPLPSFVTCAAIGAGAPAGAGTLGASSLSGTCVGRSKSCCQRPGGAEALRAEACALRRCGWRGGEGES